VIHVEVRLTLVRHVLLKLVPASWTLLWPSRTAYYAASSMQSEFNGRMLEIIREMASAAFITLPTSDADFDNPEIAADLERYMCSGTTDAKSRVKLMRLIWDFLGSEFGSRHARYEKFYGGLRSRRSRSCTGISTSSARPGWWIRRWDCRGWSSALLPLPIGEMGVRGWMSEFFLERPTLLTRI
jgi:hypothetical protein